jgi:imidazolonepropionase-like amidohydrolase
MATQAAADFGTYTMTHVYNTSGVRRAIENGVKSIEHATFLTRRPLRLKFQVQHLKPAGHRMLRWTDETSTSTVRNVA